MSFTTWFFRHKLLKIEDEEETLVVAEIPETYKIQPIPPHLLQSLGKPFLIGPCNRLFSIVAKKMVLRAFYFIRALTYYYINRFQRHLLPAIDNNWFGVPIVLCFSYVLMWSSGLSEWKHCISWFLSLTYFLLYKEEYALPCLHCL